jgi:hypothetical protein
MPTTAEDDDDDDDGYPVSKMKRATFQRPPRAHGQCTHTLGTRNRENSNLQETLLDFVACFCHFCVFGL